MSLDQNAVSQPLLFNYSILDMDTTTYLKQNAQETRGLLKRTTEDIIKIGQNLLEAKARLPHGQFIPWVKAELGISQATSWRFMQVAQGKDIKKKSFTVNDLIAQISAPASDQDKEGFSDEWITSLTPQMKERGKSLAREAIEIGKTLFEVIGENFNVGQMKEWAASEFNMDEQDIQEFCAYAHHYGETPIDDLPQKTVWEIAGTYASWYMERYKNPSDKTRLQAYENLMSHVKDMTEFHELTKLVPAMQPREYAGLVEDIRRSGLIHPITTYKGKIIDGRMRYLACRDAGVLPQMCEWTGEESGILGYIISMNLMRANWTEDQQAVALALSEKYEQE